MEGLSRDKQLQTHLIWKRHAQIGEGVWEGTKGATHPDLGGPQVPTNPNLSGLERAKKAKAHKFGGLESRKGPTNANPRYVKLEKLHAKLKRTQARLPRSFWSGSQGHSCTGRDQSPGTTNYKNWIFGWSGGLEAGKNLQEKV